jgi:peroxiredoxin Q/BCP
LHFLLKTGCPVCLRFTIDSCNKKDQLPGVTHIFQKPDSEKEIKRWGGHLQIEEPARLYRIPDGFEHHNEIGQAVKTELIN